MKMISYHTLNYLTETVYTMNDGYDMEDIRYELSTFFAKLMERRRDDPTEGGLQAGGVIYEDKAGFKISERDGHGSHAQAQENVSQYLNGETSFSSPEAVGMIGMRRNDPNAWVNITKQGFTVRIVATSNALTFIFDTNKYQTTDFQLDIILELISYIKQAYKDGTIEYPYVNYISGRDKFVFNDDADIDEQLQKLEELIISRKSETTKKTR